MPETHPKHIKPEYSGQWFATVAADWLHLVALKTIDARLPLRDSDVTGTGGVRCELFEALYVMLKFSQVWRPLGKFTWLFLEPLCDSNVQSGL